MQYRKVIGRTGMTTSAGLDEKPQRKVVHKTSSHVWWTSAVLLPKLGLAFVSFGSYISNTLLPSSYGGLTAPADWVGVYGTRNILLFGDLDTVFKIQAAAILSGTPVQVGTFDAPTYQCLVSGRGGYNPSSGSAMFVYDERTVNAPIRALDWKAYVPFNQNSQTIGSNPLVKKVYDAGFSGILSFECQRLAS